MKKEKEEMFEEISKNKALKRYIAKKFVLIFVFASFTIGLSFRLFEDKTNWDDMFIGGMLIIYSVWCLIEFFIEIGKIVQINDKKETK